MTPDRVGHAAVREQRNGPRSDTCNAANRAQCRGWIEVHIGAGFKPALAQQTRAMRLGIRRDT
jgi:hypothetical protein